MKHSVHYPKIIAACALLLTMCQPQGLDFDEDADVVYTNYNPDYNFKSKGTFAIPDKIVKITGSGVISDSVYYIPDQIAAPILSRITKNLTDLGYTKVDISLSPDLILAPAAVESTTILLWYDYWYWYWGGYYPGWGYPYYPTYTTFSTGTLIMNLVDPTLTSANGRPIDQWVGAFNGILLYTFDVNRFNALIDQAFVQSPYLKK